MDAMGCIYIYIYIIFKRTTKSLKTEPNSLSMCSSGSQQRPWTPFAEDMTFKKKTLRRPEASRAKSYQTLGMPRWFGKPRNVVTSRCRGVQRWPLSSSVQPGHSHSKPMTTMEGGGVIEIPELRLFSDPRNGDPGWLSIGFVPQIHASYSNSDFPGSWVIQYVYVYLSILFVCIIMCIYIYFTPKNWFWKMDVEEYCWRSCSRSMYSFVSGA